ncbi:AAA domain-containing protein [Modestobacter lapidis]|nr:DUF3320 domain-containing protein [Modestobacter lapidis]
MGELPIEVEALPVLSWALARAGVPPVSRLVLTRPAGAAPVQGAAVHVEVQTAGARLAEPVDLVVDLGPGRTVLTDVPLRLDPDVLAGAVPTSSGTIEARVVVDGREVGRGIAGVRVLAPTDWLAAPAPLSLEILAAYVRPADPALATLVGAASDLLEGRTGDHAVPAAPSGPDRVDERAAAIVEAVRRRAVRLTPGPADWAGTPQRVRTPTEVLDDRVGSCLDTAVVVAAAFEQAGIRPLLWVAENHAFLGYWRTPTCAEATAITAVDGLVELVESGAVQLVDPTMLTADAEPATFGDLHRTPQAAWLTGHAARVVGVVDVHRARLDGVRPLPGRGPGDDAAARPADQQRPGREADRDGRTAAPARVERWKADLVDADPRTAPAPVLRLALTVPGGVLAALGDRISGGTAVTLLPADQLGALQRERGHADAAELPPGELAELLAGHAGVHVDVAGAAYPELLRSLAAAAPAGPGGDRLFLVLGSVVADVDGRPRRAPLLLLPAALTAIPSTGAYALTLDPTDRSRLDPRLLAALRRRSGGRPPWPAALSDEGAPAGAVLSAVRDALAAADLPLRVEPTAELAVLPSAPTPLWADLDAHWAEFTAVPLVAHLMHDRPGPVPGPAPTVPADDELDELAATLPLPADATQLRAIAAATAGHTVVLAGAPGTGTSQTLANLVARSVADRRRVLVVAPRAELDVLAERLAATGLGPLVADLRPGRAPLPALPALPGAAADVRSDAAGELRELRHRLAGYARRLHEPNSAGLSLYAARTGMLPADPDAPVLPVPTSFARSASVRTVRAIRDVLAALPRLAAPAGPRPAHPWGFLDRPDVDPVEVQSAVVAVDRALDGLPSSGPLAGVLAAVRTADELDVLGAVLADLVDGPPVPLAVLDEVARAEWAAPADALLRSVNAFVAAGHPGLDVAVPAALGLPLDELADAARAAAASGLLGRTRRLSAVLDELAPALADGARVAPAELPALLGQLLAARTAARALAARAARLPGLQVPPDWNPLVDPFLAERQVARVRRLAAAAAGSAAPFTGPLRRFLAAAPSCDVTTAAAVAAARDAVAALSAACAAVPAQLGAWAGEDGLVERWAATRDGRAIDTYGLPSLRHWRELLTGLGLLHSAGLDAARTDLLHGTVPAVDAVAAFDRGLAGASLAERQAATGLGAADAEAQEAAARRFPAASAAARSSVVAALAARAADPAGAPAGPGPDGFPCVLADPESVARCLPAAAGLFDLVVLDGASRLRVAETIGALGRARTAVVAGDDRQPPPVPPDATDPAETLLDACLRAGVPVLELAWQHRGADEALVAFSDAQHYGGRISSVPSPAGGRAVSLVRVPGTFHRSGTLPGTNPAEARAVVVEVRRRFDAEPDGVPSIGVVTLHRQQRGLIERLLRDAGDDRLTEALDSAALVVAHVEGAPGLVRDVVLLSLGCSAPEGGRVPGDLGPLARAGGERWLNVAATRARQQVVVYASFDPEQLRPEETSALGVRQLRAYLDLAASGADDAPRSGRPDAHRDDVAAALRERGLVVRTDVGRSDFRLDLTVARPAAPAAPVLAVLLDGPAEAVRSTVTDRVGTPVDALRRRGWPAVERVWLPSWLADREAVLDRLVAAVESAVSPAPAAPLPPLPAAAATPLVVEPPAARVFPAAAGSDGDPSAAVPVRVTARPAVPPAMLAGERPFVPWTPAPAGAPRAFRRLTDPDVARQVRRVLAAGIAAEGPIHRDRLARLTAGAFGVARVNEARRESILALLPDPAAEFRWPTGLDPATWTWFRRQSSSAERPLEHVHPDEIGNAMVALCRGGNGMTRDELFARTLAVFGHGRRHPVLLPYLEVALAHAVRASRVTREPAGRLISAA